jgi:flotillin
MNPKINIWNTGSADGAADAMAPLRNLFTSLPPMLDVVQSQTGIKLPGWMPQAPPDASAAQPAAPAR